MEKIIDTPDLSPNPIPCPICSSVTCLLPPVDLNKNCEERRGLNLPDSGVEIYYSYCPSCGFCFADSLHKKSPEWFKENVYNADYIIVDPEFENSRPVQNAKWLMQMLGNKKDVISHLDYGGGNGVLSKTLAENGWNSTSWDAFYDEERPLDSKKFNLITAFEVFEHVPDQQALMKNIVSLMNEESVFLFSTLLSDGNLRAGERPDWWYASPRNGHISLHSQKSLGVLMMNYKLLIKTRNAGVHMAYFKLPSWL